MPKLYTIEAQVHKTVSTSVGTAYRVKVSVLNLGVYINGMMVYPPNAKFDQWGVTPPAQRAGRGKYIYTIEFNKKEILWEEIYDKCVEAAQLEYQNSKDDEVITDVLNEPISLEDIPF